MTRFKPGATARRRLQNVAKAAELATVDPGRAAQHLATAERLDAQLAARSRCRDCGRPLEDPVSVAKGIGPDCARKGS